MSRTGTTFALVMLVGITSNLIKTVDAKAFLNANPIPREERMSEEEAQTSLLAEVEAAFGEGTASSRVKQLEALLSPIYAALPKNEKGYVGHATVRYALHRLFVQRHGWLIKGLDSAGDHRNATSSAGLLKEQVPAYIQDLFEKRLGTRGIGLKELGVLAATIEHLIHNEAIKRIGAAFKVHGLLPTDLLNESRADEILESYMAAYILAEDLTKMNIEDVYKSKADMPELYMAWNETKEFVRQTRHDITQSDASAQQRASGELDFSLVARVAERVSEKFGAFQHRECEDMKASLRKMEETPGNGRVRLHDFYQPALGGQWQFQESVSYLREIGCLDESDPDKPRVIIANYLISPTNCLASSSFYAVCCVDECEGLLGHLEQQIVAPEATPARIAELVSQLTSSSVTSPRTLSASLLNRLGEIAAAHGGTIPLHGRLFSQWMHHAFPLECPYPHASGTTKPVSPDEWLENTGVDAAATDEEMKGVVEKAKAVKANRPDYDEIHDLPWAPEEELLVVRPQVAKVEGGSFLTNVRNVVLFMAVASAAYGLVTTSTRGKSAAGGVCIEKFSV